LTDDPILGDRVTRTAFTRWQDAGGVLFPRQVDIEVNNRLQTENVVTAVSTNPEMPDTMFAIPTRSPPAQSAATRRRHRSSSRSSSWLRMCGAPKAARIIR